MSPNDAKIKENFFQTYAAHLAVTFCALMSVVFALSFGQNGVGDFIQMLYPTEAFISGDFGQMYPQFTSATSLTGWVVLIFAQYAHLKSLFGVTAGFVLAGLVALPLLAGGVRYASGALYPNVKSSTLWFLTAAVVAFPTTWAAWGEFYHPQDIAATGLSLFAVGLAARNKWFAAGLVLGFAVLTRHWAILLGLPLLTFTTKQTWWKFITGAVAMLAVGILPLIAAGNEGLVQGATAATGFITPKTIPGWLILNHGVPTIFFRATVVAASVAAAIFLWTKRKGEFSQIIPVLTALLFMRTAFEIGPYAYYWAPAVTFLTLTATSKKMWLVPAAVSTVVFVLLVAYPAKFGDTQTGTLILAVAATSIAATRWTWKHKQDAAMVKTSAVEGQNLPGNKTVPWVITGAAITVITFAGFTAAITEINKNESAQQLELPGGQEILFGEPQILNTNQTTFTTGDLFPTITGVSPAGLQQTIQSTPEKNTLVAFWVHWCAPCEKDIEDVIAWAESDDVTLYAVVGPVNQQKSTKPQRFWLLDNNWVAPTVVDSENETLLKAFGLEKYPAYVLVNKEGRIVKTLSANSVGDGGR